MNNETKIISRREAVEILGKLYKEQITEGARQILTDDEKEALNIAIFCIEKDIYEAENMDDGWTPTEKGLPPVDGWYLVTLCDEDGTRHVSTDLYQKDRDGGFLLHERVIAWGAKEPYKGGEIS